MKTRFYLLLVTIVFSTSACIKKEQKVSNEGEVIKLLNQSDDASASTKIDEMLVADPENQNLQYLKASALSMSAGVDVYKLFPLLKAKIFDVAISEWSQHREFQKKMKNNRDSSIETPNEKNDYVPLKTEDIEYDFSQAWAYKAMNSPDDQSDIVTIVIGITSKTLKPIISGEFHDNQVYLDFTTNTKDPLLKLFPQMGASIGPDASGIEEFREKIIELIKTRHFEQWKIKSKRASEKSTQVKALQMLWSVTDMIPLVKQIPIIDTAGIDKLEKAQIILGELYKKNKNTNNEMYNKARKQLMMISALKLIARFQEAFAIDKIKTPYDLVCFSNSKTSSMIVNSQKDVLLILQGIDDEEFKAKNMKTYDEVLSVLSKSERDSHEDSSYREELIQNLEDAILKFKDQNCMD